MAKLLNNSLRFHKRSDKDGSGKADAYFTGERENEVWGVIFEIDSAEKPNLDRHEGLGHGYVEKQITVIDLDGNSSSSHLYVCGRGETPCSMDKPKNRTVARLLH